MLVSSSVRTSEVRRSAQKRSGFRSMKEAFLRDSTDASQPTKCEKKEKNEKEKKKVKEGERD